MTMMTMSSAEVPHEEGEEEFQFNDPEVEGRWWKMTRMKGKRMKMMRFMW